MKLISKYLLIAPLLLVCIAFLMMGAMLVQGQGMMPPTNRPTMEQWMATHTNAPNTNNLHQVQVIRLTWVPTKEVKTCIEFCTNSAGLADMDNPTSPYWHHLVDLPIEQCSYDVTNDFGPNHWFRWRTLVIRQ